MKKKRKITIFIIIAILGIIAVTYIVNYFFINNRSKNMKFGNNKSSQEIVDFILNISSYQTIIDVEVKSNKNTNKYKLKQEYKNPEINIQEVLEPQNIAGVKISKNGESLKIENSKLNLNTVLEKYQYISENALDLYSFIENYKEDSKSKFKEENDVIIMQTSNCQKPLEKKKLYIDKKSVKPIKMEIFDNNKNMTVYIVYNEINVNG